MWTIFLYKNNNKKFIEFPNWSNYLTRQKYSTNVTWFQNRLYFFNKNIPRKNEG